MIIGVVILTLLSIKNWREATQILNKASSMAITEEENSNLKLSRRKSSINEEAIKKAEAEWEREIELISDSPTEGGNPCDLKFICDQEKEYSFRIISGAANVIGPRICWNGTDIMRSKLNNVDRGMNVAVVNLEGKSPRYSTFDLYGHDSTDLKAFLNLLQPGEIILVASYDDAAFRLDADARSLLASLGSKISTTISFRDGWVFIGAKNLPSFPTKEAHIPNDKESNKYGDWPEAIEISGCITHPGSISQ